MLAAMVFPKRSMPRDSTRLKLLTMFFGANAPVPRIDAVIGSHDRRGAFSPTSVRSLLGETMRGFQETTTGRHDGSSERTRAMTTFRIVRRRFVWQITKRWFEGWISFGPDGVFRHVRLT